MVLPHQSPSFVTARKRLPSKRIWAGLTARPRFGITGTASARFVPHDAPFQYDGWASSRPRGTRATVTSSVHAKSCAKSGGSVNGSISHPNWRKQCAYRYVYDASDVTDHPYNAGEGSGAGSSETTERSTRSISARHVATGSTWSRYDPRPTISATSTWTFPSVPTSPPSGQNHRRNRSTADGDRYSPG